MDTLLTPHEARVIGCLIEKEATTPEQYPLSLNALTNACNQKSNREPVLDLDEVTVQETLDGLVKKHLVSEKSGFGSRVVKYQHRFFNSEFGGRHFSAQELGITCILLLRGPQTSGEIRTRSQRLCQFKEVNAVEAALQHMMDRDDGPYVTRLPREPGKRESRYAHLFCGEVEATTRSTDVNIRSEINEDDARIAQLEQWVMELFDEVNQLKQQLNNINQKTP